MSHKIALKPGRKHICDDIRHWRRDIDQCRICRRLGQPSCAAFDHRQTAKPAYRLLTKQQQAAKVAANEFFIALACLRQIIAPKALSIAQYA